VKGFLVERFFLMLVGAAVAWLAARRGETFTAVLFALAVFAVALDVAWTVWIRWRKHNKKFDRR
jgi:hypothetical protein